MMLELATKEWSLFLLWASILWGTEQGMGILFKSMGYLLMKNGDLCDYHKLTFTVKSATATINGKKVDLLKTDNLHIIQN